MSSALKWQYNKLSIWSQASQKPGKRRELSDTNLIRSPAISPAAFRPPT